MNTVRTLSDMILIKKKGGKGYGWRYWGKGGKREEGLAVSGRVNGGKSISFLQIREGLFN